ncbi:MAG: hypothetical protein ACD_21C00014G0015, partial [uncultured bacterium]
MEAWLIMRKPITKKLTLIISALLIVSGGIGLVKTFINSEHKSDTSDTTNRTQNGTKERALIVASSTEILDTSSDKRPLIKKLDELPSAVSKSAITIKIAESHYQPYVQLGGSFFSRAGKTSGMATTDLLIPIWQNNLTDLVFADLRLNDRSDVPFEGNMHLGYRHLSPESQQMFGVYVAFDRKKTKTKNYFNQLTFGGEYWHKNWFFGGNIYRPIGNTTRKIDESNEEVISGGSISTIKKMTNEKALPGVDGEVGYEFKEGLVGYVGGYYFGASDVNTVCGPRARLAYDLSLDNGKRILGIFDKVGLEVGVQKDKVRGTVVYLSANVRIGWLPQKQTVLQGVSRHMVDPVRRDIDIVTGTEQRQDVQRRQQPPAAPAPAPVPAPDSDSSDDTVSSAG